MSDDDELKDDPEAQKLKPLHSKRTLVLATVAGAVFGLMLAIASFILEQHYPRFGPARNDAGVPTVPEVALDVDAGSRDGSAPWLEE